MTPSYRNSYMRSAEKCCPCCKLKTIKLPPNDHNTHAHALLNITHPCQTPLRSANPRNKTEGRLCPWSLCCPFTSPLHRAPAPAPQRLLARCWPWWGRAAGIEWRPYLQFSVCAHQVLLALPVCNRPLVHWLDAVHATFVQVSAMQQLLARG